MPEGHVLEFAHVTKRFGAVTAVSDFSARVEPGVVTGFLGPNGAGKTTALRILLGLVRSTDGTATIGGKPYAKLERPLQTVGAVLEASSFHPGRTAASHLRVYARAASISNARVDDVLNLVGLADAAGRKVGGFSLGMRQRLGVAYALLGDPGVLVLDEPSNGLDPEGIRWMRGFLQQLAREGRTVLVSSHLLTEIQQTVDSLVIIARGRRVFQGGIEDLVDPSEYATVVDAPDRAALTTALADADIAFEVLRSGMTVRGVDPVAVGKVAADAGIALSTLQRRGPALEEVFLELVSGARVHASAEDGYVATPTAVAEDAEPEAETAPEPETAAEADPEAGAAPVSEVATEPEAAAEADPEAAAEPEGDAAADPEAEVAAELAGEPDIDEEPARPAFTVASTGVIDIVPLEAEEASRHDHPDDPDTPEDADPDVEQIGEIDEELSSAVDHDAREGGDAR
ncbi:ABC transporter ATP-binding protein [Microbacterium sp. SLBN-146]|uniref:ABC transporter ATP-binding protein n=1 Tax=Microbacterium sp. SLBN-146 TaxID=2768457 RepID=UPI001151D1C1|nr:ABC transporter ATP-binding protein [Microbacterium sp. SLBN-146]TQJ30186.1 ABC-2 type transport system ATP-binding protein [Microbacterium sp. SLBN-146]